MKEETKAKGKNQDPLEDRLTGMSEAQLKQELLSKYKIIGNP
jgi:hypothetical protein